MPATLELGLALGGCADDPLTADDGAGPTAKKDSGTADSGTVTTRYMAQIPDAGPELPLAQPDYMAQVPDSGIAVRYMAQMLDILKQVGFTPRACVWELTLAYNLRCKHCGSFAGSQRDDELSLEENLKIADQLAALGCRRVTLSGGEPTLNPDWRIGISSALLPHAS